MSVTRKEVEHVANLARLELSEQEQEQLTEQMNAILKYVEKLGELDTGSVEPTTHVLPVVNVMREDRVKPSAGVETALRNAPDEEDGHFKVPAVLE